VFSSDGIIAWKRMAVKVKTDGFERLPPDIMGLLLFLLMPGRKNALFEGFVGFRVCEFFRHVLGYVHFGQQSYTL